MTFILFEGPIVINKQIRGCGCTKTVSSLKTFKPYLLQMAALETFTIRKIKQLEINIETKYP